MKIERKTFEELYQNWLIDEDGAEYWKENSEATTGIFRVMNGVSGLILFAIMYLIIPMVRYIEGMIKATITCLYSMMNSDINIAVTNYQRFMYYGKLYYYSEKVYYLTRIMLNIRLIYEGIAPRSEKTFIMMYKTEWQYAWREHYKDYDFLDDILSLRKSIEECEQRIRYMKHIKNELITNFYTKFELVEEV